MFTMEMKSSRCRLFARRITSIMVTDTLLMARSYATMFTGTIDEDVWRRDFTVNGLFYNIGDESVVDYVNGMQDIRSCCIRLIGDPRQRFIEDPVRLLRAVRFATKLGFRISSDTERHISDLASSLSGIAPARLFEECLKMFF